jgi:hypothetical protein
VPVLSEKAVKGISRYYFLTGLLVITQEPNKGKEVVSGTNIFIDGYEWIAIS